MRLRVIMPMLDLQRKMIYGLRDRLPNITHKRNKRLEMANNRSAQILTSKTLSKKNNTSAFYGLGAFRGKRLEVRSKSLILKVICRI